MLDTPDIDSTLSFWTASLGFDVVARIDDDRGRALWCQVRRDDVRVMFTTHYHDDPSEDEEGEHTASLTGALYVDVDDVDAVAAALPASVPRLFGPEDMRHGMREVAVRDPNGYTIIFGQPLDG